MAKASPVAALVTVHMKPRDAIREVLAAHVFLPWGECSCGANADADDIWREHILDELFKEDSK